MENNASHQTPSTLTDDRRRFFRTCLSDAQVEFGSLESSLKVTESTLLTSMGALGTACGFNGIRGPDAARARMMSRGMDRVSIERIENDFQQIIDQQVPALEAPLTPFHTDIRILPEALHSSSPRTTRPFAGTGVKTRSGCTPHPAVSSKEPSTTGRFTWRYPAWG